MTSKARLADDLAAILNRSEPLFAAAELPKVFAWARNYGTSVVNIDPLILGPGLTEPSMTYERNRAWFDSEEAYIADCLASSLALIDYASSRGGVAYYEVLLAEECAST